jgi:hypothetical protein
MSLEDTNYGVFATKGGGIKYYSLFGSEYQSIMDELNIALAA